MKNNKFLNSKLSFLMLSVYCFIVSVQILQAMEHMNEGEHDVATHEPVHTGVEPGRPSQGQMASEEGSNKVSGSNDAVGSKSDQGQKQSPKQKGLNLNDGSEDLSQSSVNEESLFESQKGIKLDTDINVNKSTLTVDELTEQFQELAKNAQTRDEVQAIVEQINQALAANVPPEDINVALENAQKTWMKDFSPKTFSDWMEATYNLFTGKSTTFSTNAQIEYYKNRDYKQDDKNRNVISLAKARTSLFQ